MRKNLSLLIYLLILPLSGCYQQVATYTSDRGLYQKGMIDYYSNKKQTAISNFDKINQQFLTSQYRSLSILALADSNLELNTNASLNQSFSFYNSFISSETSSSYVPYSLSRLLIISLRNNEKQFFGTSLKADRANSYFKEIIDNYYRLFLFYPSSKYFEDTKEYYEIAQDILAEHELNIANWYYDKNLYQSAILRYNYLLKNYTYFSKKKIALAKLIELYRKINFLDKVQELENLEL